ncbi:protein NYNRIN-like [Grus japonensis]|uniref:ribonuclease H n=1 Tax=Grus japonensis TaxID=30415 RepID=A0ABC9YH91_GRUJA
MLANSPFELEDAVTPFVWATEQPGKAKLTELVKVEIKPGAKPVRRKQYPMKLEARVGLEPILNNFLKYGLLQECQSEYNTPILPVKKPHSQEYRLVRDLRAINQIVVDVHPVVPNPYTLLTTIIDSNVYFTVLDLKDAFFYIPLEEQSQKLFAFEWESPTTGWKMQLCWTVLPQGFKNNPTIFGNVLAKELEQWQVNEGSDRAALVGTWPPAMVNPPQAPNMGLEGLR